MICPAKEKTQNNYACIDLVDAWVGKLHMKSFLIKRYTLLDNSRQKSGQQLALLSEKIL